MIRKEKITLRTLACVISNFVASFPVVSSRLFFYRNLEHQKIIELKLCNGKFDANIAINIEFWKEINWWINNIFDSCSSQHS